MRATQAGAVLIGLAATATVGWSWLDPTIDLLLADIWGSHPADPQVVVLAARRSRKVRSNHERCPYRVRNRCDTAGTDRRACGSGVPVRAVNRSAGAAGPSPVGPRPGGCGGSPKWFR